ncbi:MAG: hypothetical protein ACRDFY_03840, partial [Candidatus Limnocylindria bacterium]
MDARAARGAPRMLGRALRPSSVGARRLAFADDPYLFYTATLIPIVLAVAIIAQRPGELWAAIELSAATLAAQAILGSIGRRALVSRHVAWHLVRLAPPLVFVAIATRTIGGPSLPLIPLYIPIVAAAAAAGTVQGALVAAFAAAVLLTPELADIGSTSAVALRGVTLAGVSLVLALGMRRIILALERALASARAAVIAERRRSRQIAALEELGRFLAGGGPTAELIERAVGVVADRFGYPLVSVYLGDDRTVRL